MRQGIVIRVEAQAAGERLDRFLRTRLPGVPARSVRFALASGLVRVNGAAGAKGRSVRAGDVVTVESVAETADWLPAAGDLPGAAVLYRDARVVVLDKPAGVHTEAHRPGERGTLAGYLRRIAPSVSAFAPGPGLSLLTRLDYETSGVVPAALTPEAWDFLRRRRDGGGIVKTYLCVVSGRLERPLVVPYVIDAAGGERVRVRAGREEPDETRWTAIEPLAGGPGWTLARARIRRGKRHQVRAHLAALGHPILGDRLYGAVPSRGPDPGRLMLHADSVEFDDPAGAKAVRVVSPAPPAFREFGVSGPG